MTCLLGALALGSSTPANAADPQLAGATDSAAAAAPLFDEVPEPSIQLERMPPRNSWEFGVGVSYGAISHWQQYFDAWVGFGVRAGWGRNMGNSRLGFDVQAVAEGPVGVHSTLGLEPHLSWDYISNNNLLLGVGVGPALLYHMSAGESIVLKGERAFGVEPSLVGRFGWSQTWSRIGRRMFVFVEPKLRPTLERSAGGVLVPHANPVVAVVVGSGRGR